MKKYRVDLWIYQRPDPNESIDELYAELARRMIALNSPLSWKGALVPPAPVRDKGDLAACYSVKYTDTALKHYGAYRIRDARYIYDEKTSDDTFAFDTKKLSANEYQNMLHYRFPEVMDAVRGYRAAAYLDYHSSKYSQLHQAQRRKLIEQANADPDGRNNIFTLNVAQFWDAELCRRALGYGRDEVIKRLTSKVPLVKPLIDGVYVVFNDNPDLTFEEFCTYNDRLKPVLGLQ
ncbi:MAG: hypothetical protein IPK59_07365 [Rhodospirillaceae bacterium]|nr:hypothetical protein [Rhodospirillaceae bacterium]